MMVMKNRVKQFKDFVCRNKKRALILSLCFVLCAIFSFLFTNYNSIIYNHDVKKINIKDIEYEGFELKGKKLIATESNPKIEIKNIGYIKKIRFNYENLELGNLVTAINYNGTGRNVNNSSVTRLFVETINKSTDSISLTFDQGVTIKNIEIDNSFSFNFYIFLLLVTVVGIIAIYLWNKEYFSKRLHKLFLLIAIPMGLLFVFESAPFVWTGLDDDYHFGVTYQLCRIKDRHEWGENAILSRRGYINFLLFNTPEEISDGVKGVDKLNDLSITDRSFPLSFSLITYLPASLILNASLAVGLSFSMSVLFAKLINLFIYILVIYYAIKIIPKYKHLLMFISLIPTSFFLASQFSYDSKVNAFLLLMLAFIIRELFDKNSKISTKSMLAIILFGIIGASAKGIYVLLILPALVIPKEKFDSKKECYIFRTLVILSVLFIFSTFMGSAVSSSDTRVNSTASAPEQISNIIHHPMVLVKAYYNSAFKEFFSKLFGNQTLVLLSSYGVVTSSNVYYLTLFVLLFMTLVDISGVEVNLKTRLSMLISSFLLICLIWGALYISFNAVGAEQIIGVQGRYFILLLLPLLICLSYKKKYIDISETTVSNIMIYSSVIILAVSLFENIIKFYCI